ncbi:MAG: NfeD family protein [Planctomycetota bacterium]
MILWACLLLVLMSGLVVVQMLLPRTRLFALLALAAGVGGLACAFASGWAPGLIALAATFLAVPLAVYLSLLWMAPFEPRLRADPATPPSAEELAALAGLEGVTQTPIDPAGVAFIAGRRINVISAGEAIATRRAVVVAEVAGHRVTVRAK